MATNFLQNLRKESSSFQNFAKGYFSYLSELMGRLDLEALERTLRELEDARDKGQKVFVVGNGGSAATASHMANDFSLGLGKALPHEKPFKFISLTDNMSVVTACANDINFDAIFVAQLKNQFSPGDRLLAISASGNSPNIVAAAEWVKKFGGRVIGFTGFSGGRLRELSDICVHVQTAPGEYGPVEDLHMIFDHLFYSWLSSK